MRQQLSTKSMRLEACSLLENELYPHPIRIVNFDGFCAAEVVPYHLEVLEECEKITNTTFDYSVREGNIVIYNYGLAQILKKNQQSMLILPIHWISFLALVMGANITCHGRKYYMPEVLTRGIGAGRKLKTHRRNQRWADKPYRKSHLGKDPPSWKNTGEIIRGVGGLELNPDISQTKLKEALIT